MADRLSDKGDPSVPKKDVFDLDKDERWQARLDEARARREVALREKAAGGKKPRPKPWEVEGAQTDAPPKIEPIIQDRGDDKFDFADRMESIRETGADESADVPAGKDTPLTEVTFDLPPDAAPDPAPDPDTAPYRGPSVLSSVPTPLPVTPSTPSAPAPEKRARPQPSLVLPGAPEAAELAARYAATLDAPDGHDQTRDGPVDGALVAKREEPTETATLINLPRDAAPAPDAPRTESWYERRKGIRPMGMWVALTVLAALPFTTEAPPLKKGPGMPDIPRFAVQPPLGVTWSLSVRPSETAASAWRPASSTPRLAPLPFDPSPVTALATGTVALAPTPAAPDPSVAWRDVTSPTPALPSDPVLVPTEQDIPEVGFAAPEGPPAPTAPEQSNDPVQAEGNAPATTPPPTIRAVQPDARPEPVERPATLALTTSPLRVTVLYPAASDPALANDIGARIAQQGHELALSLPVDYSISTRNLRYFHAEDRAEAERLAAQYDADLRDFTWFLPAPVKGTVELWLSGRAVQTRTEEDSASAVPTLVPSENGSNVVLNNQVLPQAQRPDVVPQTSIRNPFLQQLFDRLGLSTELPPVLENGSN